ncbi:MAG: hypothetical protein HZB12_01075 [Candidatus Yonathbacteria bacterium]|nr:hypothetical protein [Candidatus Yonathbacteria bacterium]
MNKLFISFTIIVLSVGFAYFYVKPLYDSTMKRRADFMMLTNIFNNAGEIDALISETAETLAVVDPIKRARFAKFLPESIDSLRFANDLQHIGAKNGIVLENIRFFEEHVAGMNDSKDTGGVGGVKQNVVNVFTIGRKEELKLAAEEKASTAAASTQASFVITSTVAASNKKYSTTKANFTFETTREKFHSFLFDIEDSLGLINVSALSFVPVPESPEDIKSKVVMPPAYRYTISIETYSLK